MVRWTRTLVLLAAVTAWSNAVRAEGDAPASQPDSAAAKAYAEMMEQLKATQAPADGLALLEKFIASYPASPSIEAAKREQGLWKERVDKAQVRWGPGWVSKDEADKKNAKAEEALNKANAETETDKAMKFLNEASQANPYRADIAFKKFEALLKANKEKDAVGALGKALSLDASNASLMNNIGVLQARQKQWGESTQTLLKAMGKSPDTDVLWDNFDQVCAMAQEFGGTSVANGADTQMRGLVAKIHKAGKHAGETRWGNSWVTDADYATKKKEADVAGRNSQAAVAKARSLGNQLKALQQRRDALRTQNPNATKQLADFEKQIRDLDPLVEKAKKDAEGADDAGPTHAGKLVLLNMDGTELQSLEPKPAEEGGPRNPREDDKPKPGKLF